MTTPPPCHMSAQEQSNPWIKTDLLLYWKRMFVHPKILTNSDLKMWTLVFYICNRWSSCCRDQLAVASHPEEFSAAVWSLTTKYGVTRWCISETKFSLWRNGNQISPRASWLLWKQQDHTHSWNSWNGLMWLLHHTH